MTWWIRKQLCRLGRHGTRNLIDFESGCHLCLRCGHVFHTGPYDPSDYYDGDQRLLKDLREHEAS